MSYFKADAVREAATGRWLFVLGALAPQIEAALRKPGRHVGCPVHGGKDGFRLFGDAHLNGGGVCNTCGPRHDGFELLMWLNAWDFRQCLSEVGEYLGVAKEGAQNGSCNITPMFREPVKPWLVSAQAEMERNRQRALVYNEHLRKKIARMWGESVPLTDAAADPMRRYFNHRKLVLRANAVEMECLRFHPEVPYFDEDGENLGVFPAIVCAIRGASGELVTLHRTYLTADGRKAAVECVKKMMPIPQGLDVNGGAVRLGEPADGVLGVAEGLETALSAYRVSQIPVWSTVNTSLMESFIAPKGVRTVLIWADRDRSLAGEKSARVLASRLAEQGVQAFVLLPKLPIPATVKGVDWNDVLMTQGVLGFPSARHLRSFIAQGGTKHVGS